MRLACTYAYRSALKHSVALFCLASAFALPTPKTAHAFDADVSAIHVYDLTTDTVLFSRDADLPLPPASMSKLMTLYLAFEAIRDGRLRMDEELRVSQHAMNYGGSTLFLRAGERVKVEDLLRGIIVLSGNDACAVIAEALSPDGSEIGFARLMTERAQQLGLDHSQFRNSNGWPAPGHFMSMRDLTLLGQHLIEDFPEYYPMFSEAEFLFDENERDNRFNRNPLLRLGIGADGLKTGHTNEAGYGLVGSAKQGERRVIFAFSGLQRESQRSEVAEAIVNWSFRQFTQRTLAAEGETIGQADVFMGNSKQVNLVADGPVELLLPSSSSQGYKAELVYDGPIRAPIAKGDQVATLVVDAEGLPPAEVPLYAQDDVPLGGFAKRMFAVTQMLIKRIQNGPVDEAASATSN